MAVHAHVNFLKKMCVHTVLVFLDLFDSLWIFVHKVVSYVHAPEIFHALQEGVFKIFKKSSECFQRFIDACISVALPTSLSHFSYLYSSEDIHTLLTHYLSQDESVEIFAAQSPLLKNEDGTDNQLSIDLIHQTVMLALEAARNGKKSVIPINTTTQHIAEGQVVGGAHCGTHWIALMVEKDKLTFLDSFGAPANTHSALIDVMSKISNPFASQAARPQIALKLLEQQAPDLSCGAWMVDNACRYLRGQELLHPLTQSEQYSIAQALRGQHQDTMNRLKEHEDLAPRSISQQAPACKRSCDFAPQYASDKKLKTDSARLQEVDEAKSLAGIRSFMR